MAHYGFSAILNQLNLNKSDYILLRLDFNSHFRREYTPMIGIFLSISLRNLGRIQKAGEAALLALSSLFNFSEVNKERKALISLVGQRSHQQIHDNEADIAQMWQD